MRQSLSIVPDHFLGGTSISRRVHSSAIRNIRNGAWGRFNRRSETAWPPTSNTPARNWSILKWFRW